MASGGLSHIALLSQNLKKTERFYTAILGLKVAFRVGSSMVFLHTPGSKDLLNFVKTTKRFSPDAALQHFGFKGTRSGLKGLENTLKASGIAIDGRRGKNAIYFRDPNGYTIEYYCD